MLATIYKRNREDSENLAIILDSVYDMENSPNGGVLMDQKEVFQAALKTLDITQAEAAGMVGWTPQKLNGKLCRKTFTANEFFEVLESIGVDTIVVCGEKREKYEHRSSARFLKDKVAEAGTTEAAVAKSVDWSAQRLSARLGRDSLRAEELEAILMSIGISFEFCVAETGRPIRTYSKGYGRRLRKMVGKVTYDTGVAEVLSNNFYADGVNEYNRGEALELYIDRDGRYFFAEYYAESTKEDKITPVSPAVAADFIERYGTEIFRNGKPTEENETPSGS